MSIFVFQCVSQDRVFPCELCCEQNTERGLPLLVSLGNQPINNSNKNYHSLIGDRLPRSDWVVRADDYKMVALKYLLFCTKWRKKYHHPRNTGFVATLVWGSSFSNSITRFQKGTFFGTLGLAKKNKEVCELYSLLKQGQGNQCRAPGVKFESSFTQSSNMYD